MERPIPEPGRSAIRPPRPSAPTSTPGTPPKPRRTAGRCATSKARSTSPCTNGHGAALTNFPLVLEPADAEQTLQAMKDPYVFDLLDLAENTRERELEQALIDDIQKFLLELGSGFAFYGRQSNGTTPAAYTGRQSVRFEFHARTEPSASGGKIRPGPLGAHRYTRYGHHQRLTAAERPVRRDTDEHGTLWPATGTDRIARLWW